MEVGHEKSVQFGETMWSNYVEKFSEFLNLTYKNLQPAYEGTFIIKSTHH